MKKRILICGATGFIGKNLIDHFVNKNSFKIRATYFRRKPDRTLNVEWVHADLRNINDVSKVMKDIDIVLQYAATTSGAKDIISKPHVHITDNAVMNSLLIREAFDQGVEHFIFPSCSIMYHPSKNPVAEKDFNESEEIFSKYYGAGNTKVYLEKMCDFFSRSSEKTKFTVLRQSNIYGPHDKFDLEKSHVFGATVSKVMNEKNNVTVWGDGTEERDLLHVKDLLQLIDLCLRKQKSKFELVNASAGKSISIDALVRKIISISKKNLSVEYDLSKPTIPTKLAVDNQKALQVFGWKPKIDLDSGIADTLTWYDMNIRKYK